MKLHLNVLLYIIINSSCIAQVQINSDGSVTGQMFIDRKGLEYYNNGIISFNEGNFLKADSLFSLALCTYKNEDIFFNRAITKILLNDTIGYCSDMQISAYSYYDVNAAKYFNLTCCMNVDTNYYDNKGILTNKSKFKYLEEVLVLKYEKDTLGFIHHKNRTNNALIMNSDCDYSSNSMVFRNTDIVGTYYINSNEKFYNMSLISPSFIENSDYRDLLNRSRILLDQKYSKLKASKDDNITLIAKFSVNKIGQISDINLVQIIPPLDDEKTYKEIEDDIINIIQQFPNLKPARMFNETVNYIKYYKLIF
jgi:hypothetical protein